MQFLLIILAAQASASVTADGDLLTLRGQGEERLAISVSRTAGLIDAPITVRVDDRSFSFGGFYLRFNGQESGFTVRSVRARVEGERVRVAEVLEHPQIAGPIPVDFTLWMTGTGQALRVKVAYPEGKLHLDRLGLHPHEGEALEPRRIFLGRMLVMNGPFQPFDVPHNYNLTRYWCFTMANGLTEVQASDRVPRGFACDPSRGRYDLYTYCDSPITYTFVFTGKGAQEAIARYRDTVDIPAPPGVGKLSGRVLIMANHPIRERYVDFLDEITGRGMRDFFWLNYWPTPGDRAFVEPYGALYGVYDMYTDIWPDGPRKAKGWSPDLVIFDRPDHMKAGYRGATRLRPEYYVRFAKTREQLTFGYELENGGFAPSSASRYSNLEIIRKEVRPNALYLDVHSSKTPSHYWDSHGNHHAAREYMKGEAELFAFAHRIIGNGPILSEGNGEAFAGLMDGGCFMDWPTPATLGVKCRDWEYYPFIDQVHRGRLLPVGFHDALMGPDPEQISLAMLFGRAQVINAYYGTPQSDPARRVQLYYLTSAYHWMLGLSRLERVEFDGDDIHAPVVTFSNGAKARVNRGRPDWLVDGYHLPPKGYLVTGPDGFLQSRGVVDGKTVERVHSRWYDYFACEQAHDFGPVVTNGALGARCLKDRVVLYELVKPGGEIRVRLDRLNPALAGRKVPRAWALLTRGRRLELKFPDLRQEGNLVRLRPVEMATCVGYELATPAAPSAAGSGSGASGRRADGRGRHTARRPGGPAPGSRPL